MILMKKLYLIATSVIILVALSVGFLFLNPQENKATGQFSKELPKTPIHWHPQLTIYINGQQQTIPANVGITIGKATDFSVSGMQMSPIHTHDPTGVLHMEQMRPTDRTMKLGYFFEVWEKKFDSECIFEYCNDGNKSVKMFVNGQPNYDFENYIPKDEDDIVIKYE